jgi:CRP/FNR family transcriptional regulator, cyclic AMP receptor protein
MRVMQNYERATRTPYGLELSDSCPTCKYRRERFFCQLSRPELKDFDAVKIMSAHPPGAILFLEQQKSRGIYVLCEGRVKLSFTSSEGKVLVLHIARPGEVLGLSSVMSGNPYEVTAQTLRPCQVAFVPSQDFKKFLREHPAVFQGVASQLGRQYQVACEQLCAVGLGATVFERMARFLLNWSVEGEAPGNGTPFTLPLSHEEVAEHIGSSRESVSRTLSEFRSRGLIECDGPTFVIADRAALAESRVRSASLQEVKPCPLHSTPFRRGRSREIRHSMWKQVANGRKSA